LSKLPVISSKKVCTILKKIGYYIDHQTGSHLILRNENPPFRRVTVPKHKEVAKGTLRSIMRQTGLTLEEFIELM